MAQCTLIHHFAAGFAGEVGRLGDGNLRSSSTPVKVAGGHTFLSLGNAGDGHTCAIAEERTATPGQMSDAAF